MNLRPTRTALAIFAGALLLGGCSTTQTRIAGNPDIYNRLSPNDQALVSRGQIRSGMSSQAAWLAWGTPDQKAEGEARGRATETWIYMNTEDAYPFGYGYPYPYWGYGFGFGGGVIFHSHHGRRFAIFGDPFYDPFYGPYWSAIPPQVRYPYKSVTFIGGRVVTFQYLVPPYR